MLKTSAHEIFDRLSCVEMVINSLIVHVRLCLGDNAKIIPLCLHTEKHSQTSHRSSIKVSGNSSLLSCIGLCTFAFCFHCTSPHCSCVISLPVGRVAAKNLRDALLAVSLLCLGIFQIFSCFSSCLMASGIRNRCRAFSDSLSCLWYGFWFCFQISET